MIGSAARAPLAELLRIVTGAHVDEPAPTTRNPMFCASTVSEPSVGRNRVTVMYGSAMSYLSAVNR